MQAYISVSFSKRQLISIELETITDVLKQLNIDSFVFVDNYKFDKRQEREMMKQAFTDIDKSDLLIAETSEKGIGIGIEVGYAKAKAKPVIYLRHITAEHSTTVSGASDYQIIYNNTNNLHQQLLNTLKIILQDIMSHKIIS